MGFPVGAAPHEVVPIVPTAVIFDLGRGGRFAARPTAEFGHRAAAAAHAARGGARARAWRSGSVGAGTGARAGGLKGGVGSASAAVPGGTVTAVAVVNAAGLVVDPASGLPHHTAGGALRRPDRADLRRLREHLAARTTAPPANTTIGLVATDVALTKTECTVLARAAHDGLARAVRPAHAMTDGDTIFGVSTGGDPVVDERADAPFGGPAGRTAVMNPILDAAAECFARACTAAVVEATTLGSLVAYRDLCPSAFTSLTA
jgi:L-aminopeptidase/D-esterase-like protein